MENHIRSYNWCRSTSLRWLCAPLAPLKPRRLRRRFSLRRDKYDNSAVERYENHHPVEDPHVVPGHANKRNVPYGEIDTLSEEEMTRVMTEIQQEVPGVHYITWSPRDENNRAKPYLWDTGMWVESRIRPEAGLREPVKNNLGEYGSLVSRLSVIDAQAIKAWMQ